MQIKKNTKTIAGIFAAAFLFSTILFSCNDSNNNSTSTADSSKIAPATPDSASMKAAVPDSMPKKDSTGTDTTKGGQNPPPRQK